MNTSVPGFGDSCRPPTPPSPARPGPASLDRFSPACGEPMPGTRSGGWPSSAALATALAQPQQVRQPSKRRAVHQRRAAGYWPAAGGEPRTLAGLHPADRPPREGRLDPRELGRWRTAHPAPPTGEPASTPPRGPGGSPSGAATPGAIQRWQLLCRCGNPRRMPGERLHPQGCYLCLPGFFPMATGPAALPDSGAPDASPGPSIRPASGTRRANYKPSQGDRPLLALPAESARLGVAPLTLAVELRSSSSGRRDVSRALDCAGVEFTLPAARCCASAGATPGRFPVGYHSQKCSTSRRPRCRRPGCC